MSDLISPKTWLAMLPSEMNEWLNHMVEEYKRYFTLQLLDLFSKYEELQDIITQENGIIELSETLKIPKYSDLKIFDDNINNSDRQISWQDLAKHIEDWNKQYTNLLSQKLNIMHTQMDYDKKVQEYKELYNITKKAQLELEKFINIRIE